MPPHVSTGDRDAVLQTDTVARGRSDTGELSLLAGRERGRERPVNAVSDHDRDQTRKTAISELLVLHSLNCEQQTNASQTTAYA